MLFKSNIHAIPWVQVVEWYHPWANLAPTLTQYMDEQDEVLVCGCGNSEMSVDMYDDGKGFTKIKSRCYVVHAVPTIVREICAYLNLKR